jgi:hypothetical protein
MPEHVIDVRQPERWILLSDLFGSGSLRKCRHNCIERDARLTDAKGAIAIRLQGNR